MRVLYISNVRQILLEELVKRVKLDGNEVKTVYFIPKKKSIFLKARVFRIVYFIFILIKTLLRLKRYDVCHIHYFARNILWTLPLYRLLARKVVITVWGSDYYYFSGDMVRFSKAIIKYVDLVSFTSEKYRKDFIRKVKFQKTKVVFFGLSVLDNINKCSADDIAKFKSKYGIDSNKIIITCGTYGAPIQQHALLIDGLVKLPRSLKEKLVFIFPMTYGSEAYIDKILHRLNGEYLATVAITKFLKIGELATLRNITSILINILKHDQFSGAMTESIYGGALVLKGSWLQYPALECNQETLQRIWNIDNIEEIESILPNMIQNLATEKDDEYKESAKVFIYNLLSWGENLTNWLLLYE